MLSSTRSAARGFFSRAKHRTCRLERLEKRELLTANPTVTAVNFASTAWTGGFVNYLESQSLGAGGYAIPAGANQTKTLPWTGLDQVKITFDQDVRVTSGDLSVSGTNVTAYAYSDFSYDSGTYTATWTLTAPLAKDKILLILDADGKHPVKNSEGQALDGAWTNGVSSFPSGDSTAGDDLKFEVRVLPGDVDGNNSVNFLDSYYVNSKNGKNIGDAGYLYRYDIDGTGSITSTDYDLALARFGHVLPSGSPAGTSNSPPTVLPLGNVGVGTNATDKIFSLGDIFADVEDDISELAFSVIGNTNSSLFNSFSISQGNLIISFATDTEGTAALTLRATDIGGLLVDMTFNVTVADTLVWVPDNEPPDISDFAVIPGPNDTWTLSGTVSDPDQPVAGMVVIFGGVMEDYGFVAIVQENGSFEITKVCSGIYSGTVTAWTFDDLGMGSNLANVYITA